MESQRLLQTTDAKVWADEFVAVVNAKPLLPVDVGFMIGWFANAMVAAELEEATKWRTRIRAALDELGVSGSPAPVGSRPDHVVLPRHALLEFFGKMALPPWTDERGRTIGGGIDCALIASEIADWIDANDLTGDVANAVKTLREALDH